MADGSASPWQVYLIATDRGALYAGITTNLERRFAEHKAVADGTPSSRGAKFFRVHKPLEIVFSRNFCCRASASRYEHYLKQLSKKQKQMLIEGSQSAELVDICHCATCAANNGGTKK